MNAGNLIDFFNQFASEAKCAEFIAQQRWGNEIVCPKCGVVGIKAYKLASGRLKCAECRKPFTVRMGTIFEDSMIPLQKWLLAIYLCTSLKKGISSIQLAKYLNVTQKTSWFMLQRIRYVFENGTFEKLKDAVEMDEAYIGGKDSNKHAPHKRTKALTGKGAQGFGSKNSKTPVVGMVERGGNLHAVVTSDTGSATLMGLARKHIDIDATVYTDEHMPYRTLPKIGYSLKYKVTKDGTGREYFWGFDRTGGSSGTTSIKAFLSHDVEELAVTDEKFDPRYEIEVSKAGEIHDSLSYGKRGQRVAGILGRPTSIRAKATPRKRSRLYSGFGDDKKYIVECTVCHKRFYRASQFDTAINSHKRKSSSHYPTNCYGTYGRYVGRKR